MRCSGIVLEHGRVAVEIATHPLTVTVRRDGHRLVGPIAPRVRDGEIRDQFIQWTEGMVAEEELGDPAEISALGAQGSRVDLGFGALDVTLPTTSCSSARLRPIAVGRSGVEREVDLPRGDWIDFWTGEEVAGGGEVVASAALGRIPVWVRRGALIVTYSADHVARGLGDTPELERPLVATLWGEPVGGRALVRLADGTEVRWTRGEWSVSGERDVTFAVR